MKDILIQAIGFAGTLTYFASFQCRGNKDLFRVRLVSYALYTAHLLLLGALTGGGARRDFDFFELLSKSCCVSAEKML